MIKNFKWLLLVSLSFVACNNNEDGSPAATPITAGSANFSKFVSLGNSLTSGFSDNALFINGQKNSYPNIMAQQFALAGGGTFSLPLMSDNKGGLLLGGNVIQGTRLYFNGVSPLPVTGPPTTEVLNHLPGAYNNMGVPGAKSFHLIAPGYGNPSGISQGTANPYFARFSSSNTTTILADALAQSPTFFSLWIGNNDVLSYATSGGVGVNQKGNLNPATYGPNDITDPNVFANVYNGLLNGLTNGGAKGVVANIPYVSSIPYFTTVPFNPVPLSSGAATQLNSGYAQYNGGLQNAVTNGLITAAEAARRKVVFQAGQNAVVIVDSYLTDLTQYNIPSFRPATKKDLLILPSRVFIGTTVNGDPTKVNGVSVPLADRWVLSLDEVEEVKVAVDAYNVSIKALASAKGLAFVDANALLNQVFKGGIRFGNYHLSSSYVTGGAFSLDGVQPSARGYALIANKFIEAINTTYGSTLQMVNLGDYQIQYPSSL